MSKNKTQSASKPSSTYKIGDRTVADTVWDGNNYVTQYNPTAGESQVMQYLQSAIPSAYQDALNGGNANVYAQNWYDNQVSGLNETMTPQLTAFKDNLITGGQVGSNTAWSKLKTLSDSYADALADLYVNKEAMAQDYRNSQLAWADALQSSMNGYYNLGNQMANVSANAQQSAANQNLDYTQYNNALSTAQNANNSMLWGALGGITGTALGSLAGPVGARLGGNLGSALGSGLSRRSG